MRWIVAPWPTFRLWRRQILWEIRSYEQAIIGERQRKVFRARLKSKYGRRWRSLASAEDLLALQLATRGGMTIAAALALPEQEATALEEAERQRQRARDDERAEREKRERTEQEEREQAERAEREAAAASERERRLKEEEDERQRKLAEARTAAELAAIEREQQAADAEAERRRAEEQIELTRQQTTAEREAAEAARELLRTQTETRRQVELTADAQERTRRETERTAAIKEHARIAAQHAAAVASSRVREPANRELGTANLQTANSEPRTPTGTSGTSTRTPRREPAPRTRELTNSQTSNSGSANAANLGDRAATKQNQVTAVVNLIEQLGYDATTLSVVQERTGMTKTTAYHRLTAARELWNQRNAS